MKYSRNILYEIEFYYTSKMPMFMTGVCEEVFVKRESGWTFILQGPWEV